MQKGMSIFYCVCARDLEFMRYSIRSVAKSCRGFYEVVVACPNEDVEAFRMFDGMCGIPYRVVGHHEPPGKGMLMHEAMWLSADKFCDSEFVLHMDADVVFWEDASPSDFLVDGKPVLYKEKFSNFINYWQRYSWKKCVANAIGIDPEFETMCRHPAVHHLWAYAETRAAVQSNTGVPFVDYVLSCRNEFPQTFCEHATIGALMLSKYPEKYHWVDFTVTNQDGSYDYRHGRDKVKAFWSHGGVGPVRAELDIITR